jgi:hypothetical protein
MKDLVVEVPSMYADHHDLRVREACWLRGVTEVVAVPRVGGCSYGSTIPSPRRRSFARLCAQALTP